MPERPPIVGLSCDQQMIEGHPFDIAGEKYITAARDGAGLLPLLIPVIEPPIPTSDILAAVDGLLFTGSPSNVSPNYYGGQTPRAGNVADENRDATTLPLIRAAIAAGVPVLCICRGIQELNVALGGTLFQHIKELPGRLDHTAVARKTIAEKYGPAHPVTVKEGGMLESILGTGEFMVNSLHAQAIDRLAPGLKVEAVAPDGTVEAVSSQGGADFLLGVQWHPEWLWHDNAQSRAIFTAFGQAVRAYAGR